MEGNYYGSYSGATKVSELKYKENLLGNASTGFLQKHIIQLNVQSQCKF